MENGLNSADSKRKIEEFGYNELPSIKRKNWLEIAKNVFKEPMFILLVLSALLYIFLGNYREGIILLSAFSIIILITYYQNLKTENSLESLRRLSSPKANVIRDGQEIIIPGRELVPDDIIIVNEGERITADASLIESLNLMVDESLLTGESVPVLKNELLNDKLIYSGTLVVQGKAIAKVISTGLKTKYGQIGSSLIRINQSETPLQKEMKKLVRTMFLIGLIFSIIVFFAYYFTRGDLIASMLRGIATSMAILPEEFPVIMTVFLALGAWKLTKKNVLTQTPTAIETLGSTSVLCVDKTGTITQNKMEVAAIYCKNELFQKWEFADNKHLINDFLFTAHNASQQNSKDPMEQAITSTYISQLFKKDLNPVLIRQYPLSRELTAMTRVLEFSEDIESNVSAKGSPEAIFRLCKISDEEVSIQLKIVHELADKGLRVIAVAGTKFTGKELPDSQDGFDFKLLGFLGLEDPVRTEVPDSVNECTKAGIQVVMITGDFPNTARSISSQIGMNPEMQLIKGDELDKLNEEELKEKINSINIFARVIPEQKLRIVNAFKANGHVVAMTGDGVNDAPALKAADIGIAMGMRGTDVAREASALILLDDNFASIVAAIRNGRKIFDNLQKAMSYVLAIHIPIIGLALIPAFFNGLPVLLMPLHIVFLELIIDPVCSVAFESEQEEKSIMTRPPRNQKEPFFGLKNILNSMFSGLLLFLVVLVVYFFCIWNNYPTGQTRAISFATLVLGNIFLILTKLSNTRIFLAVFTEKNYAALFMLLLAFLMLGVVLFVPALRLLFDFEFCNIPKLSIAFLSAIFVLVLLEFIKYFKKAR
jgi:Ca2+-transporting ATPase